MPAKEGDSQQKPPAADANTKKKRVSLHSVLFSMKKLFWANICKISVDSSTLVYKKTENSATQAEPEYRVLFAKLQGSQLDNDKYAIKTDLTKDVTTTEIFMERVPEKKAEKWLRWDEVKQLKIQKKYGELSKQLTPFDIQEMLTTFSQKNTLWRQAIMWLADDTGLKDRRLINIALAASMPIPLKYANYQKYNSHTMLYTNAHTGKTTTIYNLIGEIGATAFSETGLIGGGNKGNETEGALNGTGAYIFEETTGGGIKIGDNITPTMEYLLNYMVDGTQHRDIASQVSCKGTKALIFIGNLSEDFSFKNIMRRIMFLHDNDKHGRRLPLLCVDDSMDTAHEDIDISDIEKDLKGYLREVIRMLLKEYENNIWKFIKKTERKWKIVDREYIEQISILAAKTTDDHVHELIKKGHVHCTVAIHFSALKIFIMLNLIDIATRKIKTLEEEKLVEYNKIYESLKQMNLKSIDLIVGADERIEKLIQWVQAKQYKEEDLFRLSTEDNNELQELLHVGTRQVQRIIKKYRNMRSGIRRI